ncbi:pyrimidine dimer DNA glycosylase/endonuclease V [Agrococcus beijingensis]|uniref:pyrimidine dimer DNA glycosylase/endonuclease V n=1 Tax=Agrococcus beijingensis TaxID=3068634 RepID=UPI002741486E|nr:pyrimidine dimer DNA glycosylase/endonuclease V [Agrococcus sp. REN33]
MRLWSLHPGLLDRQGLTACWREALLAQAVIAGRTRGYTRHPQLERFLAQPDPLASVGAYLSAVADAAEARGYRFDRSRIDRPGPAPVIIVSDGQLQHEWRHLRAKLAQRSPERLGLARRPVPHPLFLVEPGPVAPWERP